MLTWKDFFNQNGAPVSATLFMTKTRTLVSTMQLSSAFCKATVWLVLFWTQNAHSMLAWQLNFNCRVTSTWFFAFLGTRVTTIQNFVAVAVALAVNYRIFETWHSLFMPTWKSLVAVDFAKSCAWATTDVCTSVSTVESFFAFDLTDKVFRFCATLYCLFVTAFRNNFHHRTLT